MPRVEEIRKKSLQFIEVPSMPWFNRSLNGGLVPGAVYLLAGGPGLGKTTLVIQVLGDAAGRGRKVHYVTTEQGLGEFKAAVERIHGKNGALTNAILQNFFVDDSIDDVDALPKFLTRKVLTAGEEYQGTEIIVIDSVQGRGLPSNATRKYGALYEFADLARAQGLVTILIGHVTKTGEIAGPKNLEHNVDCVLYLRRAFRLRPFFVPKNRFGPAVIDPVVLTMDERGRLAHSALSTAKRITVFAYGGVGDELAEAQASISLPKYGYRPELLTPFLPREKIRQLLGALSTLREVDLNDLSYQISCYLPRQQRYREEIDLALSVALLSSYVQQPIPGNTLFVGELELTTRVRPPDGDYLSNLAAALLAQQPGTVKKVFIARDAAQRLKKIQLDKDGPRIGDVVDVRSVASLEDVFAELWPELMPTSDGKPVASAPFGA